MTISTDAKILELLASRICHDIISPVGAINNGIEFMEDAGDDMESLKQASELIAHSAQAAASRLQAFRIAYGAGGRDGNIKPEDVQKTFGALTRADGKIRQSWDPFSPLGIDAKTPGFCKTLLGVMMLAMECLPKGGTVYVDPGTATETWIKAEGEGAVVREGVDKALARTIAIDEIDPRLVHPYVISLIADSLGFVVRIKETGDNSVAFTLALR